MATDLEYLGTMTGVEFGRWQWTETSHPAIDAACRALVQARAAAVLADDHCPRNGVASRWEVDYRAAAFAAQRHCRTLAEYAFILHGDRGHYWTDGAWVAYRVPIAPHTLELVESATFLHGSRRDGDDEVQTGDEEAGTVATGADRA